MNMNQPMDHEDFIARLADEGVVGIARWDRCGCILTYRAAEVGIEATGGAFGPLQPVTRPLKFMRRFGPLKSWHSLRVSALAVAGAPPPFELNRIIDRWTISYVNGQRIVSPCGPSIDRLAIWDRNGAFKADMTRSCTAQCRLLDAFDDLLRSMGLMIERNMTVRIRSGLLAGLLGRVESMDRGSVQLNVDIGGSATRMEYAIADLEFVASPTSDEQN